LAIDILANPPPNVELISKHAKIHAFLFILWCRCYPLNFSFKVLIFPSYLNIKSGATATNHAQ